MSNHTTGGWIFYDPDKQRPLTARGNPPDRRILVLHPDGERLLASLSEGYTGTKVEIPREERKANGRLMAAAPKLLAALQKLLDYDTAEADAPCPDSFEAQCYAEARAAIHLATNEPHT